MATTPAPGVTPEIEALLPCPFCGAAPCAVPQNSDQPLTGRGWMQFIWCENCNTEGPLRASEADAIAAWNRRAQPIPGTVGVREAVAEVIEAAKELSGRFPLDPAFSRLDAALFALALTQGSQP